MSQKTDIEEMLAQGKGYDEIEDSTGSNRSYIRSVAVTYRNREANTKDEVSEEEGVETKTPETSSVAPSLTFVDDSPKETKTKTTRKSHKEWVKAAKYECGGCGATIGRTQDFCAHCGKTLVWEGIE